MFDSSLTDLLTELSFIDENDSHGFRFQNQKCMLTYKTHVNKDDYKNFIVNKFQNYKRLYIAHENGVNDPKTPYEHSHVVIDFGRRIDTRNARAFDFGGIHPHISKIINPTEWIKACKYITKEDKSFVLEEDDRHTVANIIWGHESIQDAVRQCKNVFCN